MYESAVMKGYDECTNARLGYQPISQTYPRRWTGNIRTSSVCMLPRACMVTCMVHWQLHGYIDIPGSHVGSRAYWPGGMNGTPDNPDSRFRFSQLITHMTRSKLGTVAVGAKNSATRHALNDCHTRKMKETWNVQWTISSRHRTGT